MVPYPENVFLKIYFHWNLYLFINYTWNFSLLFVCLLVFGAKIPHGPGPPRSWSF